MVTTAAEDPVSRTFAALADPTRRAILERLARGDLTVNEVAEPFEMSLQAVSKHLKVLEAAGLVARGRHAQWRPVRLDPAGLETAAGWIAAHQSLRIAQLDRMAGVLAAMGPSDSTSTHNRKPDNRNTDKESRS